MEGKCLRTGIFSLCFRRALVLSVHVGEEVTNSWLCRGDPPRGNPGHRLLAYLGRQSIHGLWENQSLLGS